MEILPGAVYTLREACQLLRISEATARRWIKEGRLHGRKIGRDYRLLGSEMIEALEWHKAAKIKLFGPENPLMKLIGIAEDEEPDVAEHHDKYLAEIYARKTGR